MLVASIAEFPILHQSKTIARLQPFSVVDAMSGWDHGGEELSILSGKVCVARSRQVYMKIGCEALLINYLSSELILIDAKHSIGQLSFS